MYAVIKTGGKQYRVEEGTELEVEKLDAEAGDSVQFTEVLMLGGESPAIGTPRVDGAAVTAEILVQGRGPKIYNFVKRRRKHSSKRLKGHRQDLTTVRITGIVSSGADETGIAPAVGAGRAAREKARAERGAAN